MAVLTWELFLKQVKSIPHIKDITAAMLLLMYSKQSLGKAL